MYKKNCSEEDASLNNLPSANDEEFDVKYSNFLS
jgi:hypothetical protein